MKTLEKDTIKLEGKRLYLRILKAADVGEEYVRWMNNAEVLKYTESRGRTFTADDLREYVKARLESPADYFFGIYLNDSRMHIGNIKIGNIQARERSADVGLIIADDHWNRGYATESIRLITDFGFKELALNRLWAQMQEINEASFKAFIKCGYKKFGYDAKRKLIRVEVLRKDHDKK